MKPHLLKHLDAETRRRLGLVADGEILQEGEVLRVPMKCADGVSRTVVIGDGSKNFAGHHAGWRLPASSLKDGERSVRQKLYDEYDQRLSRGYLNDDYGAQSRGSQPGDLCTVRASGPNDVYAWAFGSPGHLDKNLVCVPDADPRSATGDAKRKRRTQYRDPEGREQGTAEEEEDLQDARKARDAAYLDYEKKLTSAWKQPINDHTPSNKPRRPAGVILHDTTASAYRDYDLETANAWRRG
jgi:hypothetical protein